MGSKQQPYVPPPPVDVTAEADQRNRETAEMEQELKDEKTALLNKKKSGRYATLLTGGEGDQDDPDIKTRSLLGSGTKP